MRSQLLQDTFERVARTISARANVEVVMRGNELPRTNGKTIWLPSLPAQCSPAVERALHGTLDHETAHCIWTNFKMVKPFRRRWGERGFHVLNALEDLRIDRRMEREFPGSKANLADSYRQCLDKWKENVDQLPLWPRVVGCLIATGKGWSRDLYGADAGEVVAVVEDLVLRAPRARSTKAISRLAEQVLARWKDILNPKAEKEQEERDGKHGDFQTSGSGSQTPQDRSSGSDMAADSPAQAENAGKAKNQGRSLPDTSQDGEATPETDPLRESIQTLFESEPSDEAPSLGRYLQATLNELPASGANMPYRVFSTADDVVETAPDLGIDSYNKLMEDVRAHVSGLRQKLLLTLRAKAQSRWVSDSNGSRLDRRRLHTLCLDSVTAPPFVSRSDGTNQDVAFSLLVDQSGSMLGEKIELACQCAVLLAETLDKLGLPLEIIGFTTTNDSRYLGQFPRKERAEIEAQFARYIPTRHIVYKGFDEPFRRCRGRFASMEALHYTPLNESVMLAGKRMMEQKATRRVLVVLTDGMTFLGSHRLQSVADTNLTQSLKTLGRCRVETVGVGIQAPFVGKVFDRSIVVDDVSELPKQFYQLMADLLMKTARKAA